MTGIHAADLHVGYDDLRDDCFGLRSIVPAGAKVAIRSTSALSLAAAVFALDGWATQVVLVGHDPREIADAVVLEDAHIEARAGAGSPVRRLAPADGGHPTSWTLLTSGTTGTPKEIDHSLSSLSRRVRVRTERAPLRWGLVYEANRMAGTQVVLQAMAEGAPLFDATGFVRTTDKVAWMVEHGVEALSATPAMWRQILQVPASSALPLRQITLGGEIADQSVLHALARRYPDARVTHVFASTETGSAFGVSDGKEGFPLSYLDNPPHGVRLDVRDGILQVYAPGSSAAGDDGFASTGDVVEIVGDRVLFRGRESGAVNVGGAKVWPEEVEAALRTHPDVAEALVSGRRNPISGWILTAAVVPSASADSTSLPSRLRHHCAGILPTTHVPAVIKVVTELAVTPTGKVTRR
ncbi:MAG: AMP-binding protein [Acidimicrobiia bacterium]